MNNEDFILNGGYLVSPGDLMVLLLFISISGIFIPQDVQKQLVNNKTYYKIKNINKYKPYKIDLKKFTNEFLELDNKDSIFKEIIDFVKI